MDLIKPVETIIDFITGREIPNTGAEENRQAVERFLVLEKGYDKQDILVNAPLRININGEPYDSVIDLVVFINQIAIMAIKCAAGYLGSREREILAAARLYGEYQIPISIVSDGKNAIILDTVTGKTTGNELTSIPSKNEALKFLQSCQLIPFPHHRMEREKIIFRSYDMMNVNRIY